MTQVSDFISVNITRETSGQKADFSAPMFLASHAAFNGRYRVYTALADVLEDFASTSEVYIALSQAFSQELTPTRVVVGKRAVKRAVLTVPAITASTAYTAKVGDQVVSFTSDATPTSEEILAGLAAAITAEATTNSLPITATVVSSTVQVDYTGTVAKEFSIRAGANTAVSYVEGGLTTETYVEALQAVAQEYGSFYSIATDAALTDKAGFAGAVETMKRLYFVSQNTDFTALVAGTDLATVLKGLGYVNTFVLHNEHPEAFPEVAIMAHMLQYPVGSATAKFKKFKGITPSKLTSTQVSQLKAVNYNIYETVGGSDMLSEGKVVQGEFLDVIVTAHWTDARVKERLFFRLTNTLKIPFTRAGATIIEAELRGVYQEGVISGAFNADVPPVIYVPDPQTLDAASRASRTFDGITFDFRLAGAVHFLTVRGNLSL